MKLIAGSTRRTKRDARRANLIKSSDIVRSYVALMVATIYLYRSFDFQELSLMRVEYGPLATQPLDLSPVSLGFSRFHLP